jgi:Ca2+-binding EF-hand superfamily protein
MARWLASLLAVMTAIILLNTAEAQDTKKPKLDVDVIFRKLDSNSDGKLAKDEFLRLADRFKDKEKARQKLTSTYNTIDPKNVGLSKDQFRKYLDSVKKKDETPRKVPS